MGKGKGAINGVKRLRHPPLIIYVVVFPFYILIYPCKKNLKLNIVYLCSKDLKLMKFFWGFACDRFHS